MRPRTDDQPRDRPGRETPLGLALGRLRDVLDRLLEAGNAVARSDGSVHRLFPVAVGAAEGAVSPIW